MRSVNWPDSQRKLSVAGRVLPTSRRLLHAVSTLRVTLRTTAPLCRIRFVSEAFAFHKSLRSCSFFICTFIVKKSSVWSSLLLPPLRTNSAKSQRHFVSVELVFHIINYNYLSSKGIKKQTPTSGSGRDTKSSAICICQPPFPYGLRRAKDRN